MIFRARNSYSITLKRAHNLLGIPKDPPPPSSSISHGQVGQVHISREQIQEAFRKAAKCYHPDIIAAAGRAVDTAATTTTAQTTQTIKNDANRTFRECNEARELLLDYYIHRKFYIPPEVIKSVKDHPPPPPIEDESLFSIWTHNHSFQLEVFLRLSVCLGLAVTTYYHDLGKGQRRKEYLQRRDNEFYSFGPQR